MAISAFKITRGIQKDTSKEGELLLILSSQGFRPTEKAIDHLSMTKDSAIFTGQDKETSKVYIAVFPNEDSADGLPTNSISEKFVFSAGPLKTIMLKQAGITELKKGISIDVKVSTTSKSEDGVEYFELTFGKVNTREVKEAKVKVENTKSEVVTPRTTVISETPLEAVPQELGEDDI